MVFRPEPEKHPTTDYLIYSAEYQLYKTKKNGKLGKFGCNDENYRHYYIKQFLPDWRIVAKPHMPQKESLTHVYLYFRANDLPRRVSYSIKILFIKFTQNPLFRPVDDPFIYIKGLTWIQFQVKKVCQVYFIQL